MLGVNLHLRETLATFNHVEASMRFAALDQPLSHNDYCELFFNILLVCVFGYSNGHKRRFVEYAMQNPPRVMLQWLSRQNLCDKRSHVIERRSANGHLDGKYDLLEKGFKNHRMNVKHRLKFPFPVRRHLVITFQRTKRVVGHALSLALVKAIRTNGHRVAVGVPVPRGGNQRVFALFTALTGRLHKTCLAIKKFLQTWRIRDALHHNVTQVTTEAR